MILICSAISQFSLNSYEPNLGDISTISRNLSELNTSYFIEHIPIEINSNQEFEQITTNGTGSQEDPYVIERLHIIATGTQNSSISVSYTSAYFIIRDCYLETDWACIEILQTAAGRVRIENNTCISNSDDGAGIVVWGTQNATVVGNRCSNLAQGIHLNEAGRCYIAYNNISDNSYQGINIRYSHFNTIIGNIVTNNTQHGLAFVGTSNYNVAHHNQFVNNGRDDTYRIDGEPRGELTSQGFDEGDNNTWYDTETEEGNWWSDYSGSGSYAIDGPSNSVDQYPNTVDDQPQSSGFNHLQIAVLISFVGGIVILLIWQLLRSKSSEIS